MKSKITRGLWIKLNDKFGLFCGNFKGEKNLKDFKIFLIPEGLTVVYNSTLFQYLIYQAIVAVPEDGSTEKLATNC